jgi:hypothetical protein
MSGAEQIAAYRLHSAMCAEIAQRTADPRTKLEALRMAQAWLLLADQAERNAAHSVGTATPTSAQQQQQPQPKE